MLFDSTAGQRALGGRWAAGFHPAEALVADERLNFRWILTAWEKRFTIKNSSLKKTNQDWAFMNITIQTLLISFWVLLVRVLLTHLSDWCTDLKGDLSSLSIYRWSDAEEHVGKAFWRVCVCVFEACSTFSRVCVNRLSVLSEQQRVGCAELGCNCPNLGSRKKQIKFCRSNQYWWKPLKHIFEANKIETGGQYPKLTQF